MSVYLHDIPLSDAHAAFDQALTKAGLNSILSTEILPLDEKAVGRTLAEPVWAKISSPHYHASAMDGFAVRAFETDGALLTAPKTLLIGEQALYVDTGEPLPDWANAVIMIEQTEPVTAAGEVSEEIRAPYAILIRESLPPWKNVRPMGEDMVATQLVLPAGHLLRPIDLGAIAGCGHHEVVVAARPKVAVLPTGTELKEIGQPVEAGDIIEYNSIVLAGQINEWGGIATRLPITADRYDAIVASVSKAAEDHDLVLLNAGSSAGKEDYSSKVIDTLGDLLVHGVAVRPGHPVILGMIDVERDSGRKKVPVVGVPGYPVSAALTGEIFVEPLLARWLGRSPVQKNVIEGELTRKHASPLGDDEYARVLVGRVGNRTIVAPLSRGAGVISSLVRADGIAIFPSGSQGQAGGSSVQVHLYRSRSDIERTILAIGSHDMTLDLLAQFLTGRNRRLASSNVGSLGGLVALRRGEAHLAGSHLLDPESGVYNLTYLERYLSNRPVKVITLVGREQGLILPRENPKSLATLADLAGPDILYVNRQRGAGTRVLLDYQLEKLGIKPEQIQGYEREEFTHLAVAAAIASGRADAGLGIAAAARALELDFVPLFQERFDLIIPTEHFEDPLLAPLITLLSDPEFKKEVKKLPGYHIEEMGNVVQ